MFFTDTEGVGGSEKYLVDMISAMIKKGDWVSLLCHENSSFVNYVCQQTSGKCQITAMYFPSVTRSQILQKGLALNRSWNNRFSFLKGPGQLIYYFNLILAFTRIRRFLRNNAPEIIHVVSGGYPAARCV